MTDNKKGGSATNRNRPSNTTKPNPDNTIIQPWMAITAFQDTICDAGLGSPEIKPDQGIIRFSLPNEKKGKSGWYVMFTDNIYAGKFGSWVTGESTEWSMKANNKPLSPEEKKAFAIACKRAEQKRTDETNQKHRKAAKIAQSIWANASPCSPNAPYLLKKKISSCAKYLRQDKKHGNILVPLYADKQISSLQFISNKNLGAKWYLTGGKVASAYYLFGDLNVPFKTAYIAEGLASAYSCFLLLDHAPVFISFTASNLINVAKLLRAQFKDIEIVILADNDVRDKPNEVNTGIVEAEKAASAVNASVSIPSHPSGKKVDFNDLYVEAIEAQEKEKTEALI